MQSVAGTDINWLRDARIFAFESWWPPFWPHLEVDWDRALWTMERLHLDTLQANALTKWSLYPTELVQPHPELGDQDLLRQAEEFCEKHDFRWIIYTLFGHAMPLSTQLSKPAPAIFRPLIRETRPQPVGHRLTVPEAYQEYATRFHFGDERYVTHCVFAAQSWLTEMADELASGYDYHAAWIDGSIQTGSNWSNDGMWNVCTCDMCQRAYWRDFGKPMPLVVELGDPRLTRLRRWAMKRLDGVLSEVAAILTRNRQLPLVGNVAHGMGSGCFYPPIIRQLNGGLFEHAPDQIDLVRKVSDSRHLVETAIHYPDCYDPWPRRVTSGWEVENKGLTILAHGGTPYLAMPGKYYYDDSRDEPAERIFAFMEAEKDVLSQQAEYAYAVVASLPTTAPADVLSFQEKCARGWVSALLDGHVPVGAIASLLLEDANRIAEYPVLVLPNLELLSEAGLKAVRAYVEDGGGAYLSGDPARLDEDGRERKGALIRDILDLEWRPIEQAGREEKLRRCKFELDKPHGQTYDVYLGGKGAEVRGFPVPGERVFPTSYGQTAPGESWQVVANLVPTDEDSPLFPAVAVRDLGKGRMVFSPVVWGYQYAERRDPDLAMWMKALVKWLGNRAVPVEVTGSRMVELGTTRVDDGWLVYLINNSNNVQPPRQYWREMMKVAERPLPLGRVEVRIPGAESATALYGPQPDSASVADGCLSVSYGNLDQHVVLHAHPLTRNIGRRV